MAWEQPAFNIGTLVSDADMASNQYKFVKMSATNNTFSLCDTIGEKPLGILQDKQGSGLAGDIMIAGISKLEAGETLVAGNHVGTNASGTGRVINIGVTAQDLGMVAAGQVIEGASSGELATVIIGQPLKVEEA